MGQGIMKAIQVRTQERTGGSGSFLAWEETAEPACGPDEVLVDVYAASVNRADLSQRAGHYPPPPGASEILGLDMAGRVAATGAQVRGWQPGDRVCALLPGGGYAERVVVPQRTLIPIPAGWSDAMAAALPEVFLTAFVNIFMEANFQAGETVLVHGGASGVGTAAIQLVRHAGGTVIITAGTDEKVARCRELGAELAVNYRTADFAEAVRAFTGGAGVDIILDIAGAAYLQRNLDLLRPLGRLVLISTLTGARADIDLRAMTGRRLRIIGSALRSRPLAEKIQIKDQFLGRFGQFLENGTIRPVIDSVYPIHEAEEAHRRMAANENIGKIILKVR
jgi:putative PIG3 family NAD(P)H quinone oxidoreductase